MRVPHTFNSWTDERKEAWLKVKSEKRKSYDAKPERKAASSKRSKAYYANNKEKCKSLHREWAKKKRFENEEKGLIKFKPSRDLSPLESLILKNYKARIRRKNRSEESKEEYKRKQRKVSKLKYNLLRIKRNETLSRNPKICKICKEPHTTQRQFYCSDKCSKIARIQRNIVRHTNNPELKKIYVQASKKRFPDEAKEQGKKKRSEITNSYIADLLGVPTIKLKKFPNLIHAKREQIKILRKLKQEKQNAPKS
tara:strand:+ start:145 stop:903 length:759 start_codon:yes stop_codon:yes gene_type:complete